MSAIAASLAERKCAGRMPSTVTIAPSTGYPWYGSWRAGRALTDQQHAALISANIDVTNPETITVRRNATDREMWWGLNSYPPYFEFECPVVARLADGRIKVIAPSGDKKIVLKDGWVTRPGKRKTPSVW